ncbi:MAG: hypothetical protein NTZ97_04150 [Candidatus Moranbacteria bacterium]|nr:hypothetical protein [Candidatus Moranbacteria bacterium]
MQDIKGIPKAKLLQVAETVVEKFINLPQNPNPGRKGCYIGVVSKERGIVKVQLATELGYCKPEKVSKYFRFCLEKPMRILEHGEFSSWQSRDVDSEKYGGAVTAHPRSKGPKAGRGIAIGISGFTEHGDEAVALVIGLALNLFILEDAKRVIKISGNELFYPMVEKCAKLFM